MNLSKVCVDASLALMWFLTAQQNEKADALRRQWKEKDVQMVGPAMFYAEVTSVLREHVFWGKILPEEGEEALSICLDIPVRTVDNPEVYRRAWELARRFNLPRTYDMQYLAVAELEDCEFWTADRKLANSLRNKVKRIRWVGDYGK